MNSTKPIPTQVRKFFAKIGRKGGSKSTPKKAAANRRNVLLRWKRYREEHPA